MITPNNKKLLLDFWLKPPGKACIEDIPEIWDACESGQIDGSRELENFFCNTANLLTSGTAFQLWNCEMTVEFGDGATTFKLLVVATSAQAIVEHGPLLVAPQYQKDEIDSSKISFQNIQHGTGPFTDPFHARIDLVIPYN